METTKQTKVALAKKLGIARSSLYYKPKRTETDEALKNKVLSVMTEHPAYGHRRIAMALELNKKSISRIMRKHGFKPKLRRVFTLVKLDDLGRPETLVTNILKVICPIRPNIVWAGDFTYLWLIDRFWYVATVIDVHTREVLGWHIANHHSITNVLSLGSRQ
jgi:transposase InsO family protein